MVIWRNILFYLVQENNVRVHIPPPSVQKDEIVVTGEKDGVAAAVAKIKAIYNRKVSFRLQKIMGNFPTWPATLFLLGFEGLLSFKKPQWVCFEKWRLDRFRPTKAHFANKSLL